MLYCDRLNSFYKCKFWLLFINKSKFYAQIILRIAIEDLFRVHHIVAFLKKKRNASRLKNKIKVSHVNV